MELYAAGFNAWNQLRFNPSGREGEEPDDLYAFTCVLRDDLIGDITSWLSWTSVETSKGAKTAGLVPSGHGALRARFQKLAQALNGSVLVSIGARTIRQYPSTAHALAGGHVERTLNFLDDVAELVAYDAGSAVLTCKGDVWTWGDERYPACLGREATAENPAVNPSLVEDLQDLPTGKITKLAAGGYVLAALTAGNDLYCWGGHPGRKPIIEDISPSGHVPAPIVVSDDCDVVDVGVGESHLIVLTDRGEVFVVGDNGNGQLGIGSPSVSSWTKIEVPLAEGRKVVGVAAGPRCSFITVQEKQDQVATNSRTT